MPVKISFVSKINTEEIAPLRLGQPIINIKDQVGSLEASFLKGLQAICTALDSDAENSKGTALTMILVNDCTTLGDPKPQDIAFLIPPSKAPKFKIKAMIKLPGVKKSKKIGVFQIIAVGEKEEGLQLIDLNLEGGKFKLTPIIIARLNKLGKKKGLKFRKPVQEEADIVKSKTTPDIEKDTTESSNNETVKENTPIPQLGQISAFIQNLDTVEYEFQSNPSKDTLKAFYTQLAALKNEIEALAKESPANMADIKQAFRDWNQKFVTAKKQLMNGDVSTPEPRNVEQNTDSNQEEGIHRELEALNIEKEALKKSMTMDDALDLLVKCQKLRTAPSSKVAFKADSVALKKFKALRNEIITLLDGDIKDQLAKDINDPEAMKIKIKSSVTSLWATFIKDAESAETFQLMADEIVAKLLEDIKTTQKEVSEKALGLLEASRMMKIGDPLVVSENMTEVRSAIAKLKNHLQVKFKEIKASVKKMAALEVEVLAETDETTKNKKIDEIETIANSLEWETTWENFSYNE